MSLISPPAALEPLRSMLDAAAQAVPLGIEPGLRADAPGWLSSRAALPRLVAETGRRWDAPPHVAAALWWKAFSYWTSLPVALGWALNRRIPVMTAETVRLRPLPEAPYMVVGLAEVRTGADVRHSLIRGLHAPLIDALHDLTRTGRRGLWGSVAEALAHPLTAYGDRLPGEPLREAAALLEAAGPPVRDLVELSDAGVRRRTCCLWLTLPGREACQSCCVTGEPPTAPGPRRRPAAPRRAGG